MIHLGVWCGLRYVAGSLGGTRPGPPSALFPNVLGQVYQTIDSQTVGGHLVWG